MLEGIRHLALQSTINKNQVEIAVQCIMPTGRSEKTTGFTFFFPEIGKREI